MNKNKIFAPSSSKYKMEIEFANRIYKFQSILRKKTNDIFYINLVNIKCRSGTTRTIAKGLADYSISCDTSIGAVWSIQLSLSLHCTNEFKYLYLSYLPSSLDAWILCERKQNRKKGNQLDERLCINLHAVMYE